MEQVETTLEGIVQPKIDRRALTPPTPAAERRANLLVIVTVLVALVAGWVLMTVITGRTGVYRSDQLTFHYPATWLVGEDDEGHLMLWDPNARSQVFSNRVVVINEPAPTGGLPGSSPLAEAATTWTLRRSRILDSFRNLATEEGYTVAGLPAIRMDYAYVADPSATLGRPGIPVVVRGSDLIVLSDDRLIVLSGQARASDWEDFEPQFLKIVRSAAGPQAAASSQPEGGS